MRSPEKWGYSVGKLCPTAKLCISAVFGPKSLYSGLAIRSLPAFVLNEANIIHETKTTYPAMRSQSAVLDPRGRGRYKFDRVRDASPGGLFTILRFHLGQDRSATDATKNNRLAHKRGRDVQKKASPARYVNHELASKPTRIAAAYRCATDSNW